MFSKIHVFQGPGFSGPRSRVQVQVLEVALEGRRSKANHVINLWY